MSDFSVLLHAIEKSDVRDVADVLSLRPKLLHKRFRALQALHHAVTEGSDPIVARLLAATPIHFLREDDTLLRSLATATEHKQGYKKIAARLLAANPDAVDTVDENGWTVLHHACAVGNSPLAEMFLSIRPQLAFVVSKDHAKTPLHLASMEITSRRVLQKLLKLNPEPLWSGGDHTPYHIAMRVKNDVAIEEMQPRLPFDDLVNACAARNMSFEQSYRPVVEVQLECLKVCLNQDVLGIVYEYLGFTAKKEKKDCTRGKTKKEKSQAQNSFFLTHALLLAIIFTAEKNYAPMHTY